MTRRVLVAFGLLFAIALSTLWFVHRRSVERALALVRVEHVAKSLRESRAVARDSLVRCDGDAACQARLETHVKNVERDLLSLAELDVLEDEIAVSLAVFGFGPFLLLLAAAYAALLLWTRRLFTPLRALSASALRYASGDESSFPVPERGPEEVATLAVALNQMIATIRRQSTTLTAQARSLGWHEIAREVVHESRNVLTPLKLGAEGLVERADDEADAALAREAKRLVVGLAALERITTALKDLSARRFPSMAVVRLDHVLDRAAELHRGRGVVIEVSVGEGAGEAIGDEDLLAEALGNVVVNAIEARADRVVLSTSNKDGDVVIECSDDGRGIAPENVARITMLGFSTKASGGGFGLYFASKLATELGGHLAIDSEPSRGTRVRMVLRPSSSERS